MSRGRDAAQKLKNLEEYANHFKSAATKVAKDGGNPEHTHVDYLQMAQILDDVVDIMKGLFGVGLKKNDIGQAYPEKRSWEVRG